MTLETYTEALFDQVPLPEWEAFVRWAISTGRFSWFPKISELLDVLAEFRGAPSLDAEAVAAYDRVNRSSIPTNDGPSVWQFRHIAETCGKAAAEAFMAAGGDAAFRTTWDEDKTRAKFVEAYQRAVRADPTIRLLPAANEPRLLPAGDAAPAGPLTGAEAKSVLGRLDAMRPKVKAKPVASDAEWEARKARLLAQAKAAEPQSQPEPELAGKGAA